MREFSRLALSALMCLSVSCAVRSSTLRVVDVSPNRQHEINTPIAAVAARFGFRSDASEYFAHDTLVGEGWLVVGKLFEPRNRSGQLIGWARSR